MTVEKTIRMAKWVTNIFAVLTIIVCSAVAIIANRRMEGEFTWPILVGVIVIFIVSYITGVFSCRYILLEKYVKHKLMSANQELPK